MNRQMIETFCNLKRVFQSENFNKAIVAACQENKWFTEQMVRFAVDSICCEMLDRQKLSHWLEKYQTPVKNVKRVGIICAGNIPMVGFYDLMCACFSGHYITLKPSSKDSVLMNFICAHIDADIDIVRQIDRYDIDMLIATGSNQTAESVGQNYQNIRSIIRHNRKSVALLTGDETREQLKGLSDDIFLYFGLGCRNVSHIFVPHGYDFERLRKNLKPHQSETFEQKAKFERAMAIMNTKKYVDAQNFVFLEQDYKLETPIGTVSYSYYDQIPKLDQNIIQCTVGFNGQNNVEFGCTQKPTLDQTPDGIDVIQFLISE